MLKRNSVDAHSGKLIAHDVFERAQVKIQLRPFSIRQVHNSIITVVQMHPRARQVHWCFGVPITRNIAHLTTSANTNVDDRVISRTVTIHGGSLCATWNLDGGQVVLKNAQRIMSLMRRNVFAYVRQHHVLKISHDHNRRQEISTSCVCMQRK